MIDRVQPLPADADGNVDAEILECINPDSPRSFFLYAGAGSGKTYSLVLALNAIRKKYGDNLRVSGRKIAVITFTNAASDEISSRIDQDSQFVIKTIHSFCWQIIKPLQADIQSWLLASLPEDIAELNRLEAKGRAGAASIARLRSIESKHKELEWLSVPRTFSYSPNDDNIGKGALSHADVIKIASDFLEQKPSLQQIIINNFPIIFIDESQDTNKKLMQALLAVEDTQRGKFALGLFGDMMQRIYSDGLATLAPPTDGDWATPIKKLNRRSTRRVIELGNAIRSGIDDIVQHPMEDVGEGVIRLFIADAGLENKPAFEEHVRSEMATIASDEAWADISSVKQLMLEHSMAAERMRFSAMFEPLRKDKRRSTSLMEGTLPAVRFFSTGVLPLWEHWHAERNFQVMSHLTEMKSPLLDKSAMSALKDGSSPLEKLKGAVTECCTFLTDNPHATFGEVLNLFATTQLLRVPESLHPFVGIEEIPEVDVQVSEEEAEEDNNQIDALSAFLKTPFSQIKAFAEYVIGNASFDTHQGVKGLEFDRVQVVLDDAAAGGFLFSYERLFGVKALSDREQKNINDGIESSIDRTSRLLYVTCTRAAKSLVLIAYTANQQALAEHAIHNGWFQKNEVVVV